MNAGLTSGPCITSGRHVTVLLWQTLTGDFNPHSLGPNRIKFSRTEINSLPERKHFMRYDIPAFMWCNIMLCITTNARLRERQAEWKGMGEIMWRGQHTHTCNALTCIVLKLACSNYPAAELLGWQDWKWVPIIKCTTEKIEHYRRSTMGLMLLCLSSINAKRLRKALIFQLFQHWLRFKRKSNT